jgi:hypothetical protein
MSTVEHNKKTLMRYFDEIGSQRKIEVIDEIFSPDYLKRLRYEHGEEVPRSSPSPLYVGVYRWMVRL